MNTQAMVGDLPSNNPNGKLAFVENERMEQLPIFDLSLLAFLSETRLLLRREVYCHAFQDTGKRAFW
jgi:hypothetical protein